MPWLLKYNSYVAGGKKNRVSGMTVVEYLFVTSNSPNAVISVCGLITAAQRSAARLA